MSLHDSRVLKLIRSFWKYRDARSVFASFGSRTPALLVVKQQTRDQACLTFSPDNQHCLLGCKNGTIFVAKTGTLCPGFRPSPSTNHDESESEGSRDWTMGKTLVAVNNGQSTSSRRIFGSLGSSDPSAVANASASAMATSASGNVPRSDH